MIGIYIAAGVVTAIAGWCIHHNSVINKFRRESKIDDHCAFYVDNDRTYGCIIGANATHVVIYSMDGIYYRTRNEIYPA